ncbi:MAG: hypothetical protein GY705_21500 [Bacteroidetes bacterium]|nr:hypothetical protein [Bacteroidota bacterium]
MTPIKLLLLLLFSWMFLLQGSLQAKEISQEGASPLPKTIIRHQASDSFSNLSDMAVQAYIHNNTEIKEARCYFRFSSEGVFYFREMSKLDDNLFSCFIPTLASKKKEIEYYFLIVNDRKQVIRSASYWLKRQDEFNQLTTTIERNNKNTVSLDPVLTESLMGQQMSLIDLSINVLPVTLVSPMNRYAHRIGALSSVDCGNIVENVYVGGFEVLEFGNVKAIPGSICASERFHFFEETNTLTKGSSPDIIKDNDIETDTVSYIDIKGKNWEGSHFRSDIEVPYPISAEIVQSSTNVTIETTEVDGLYPAHHFTGTISLTGDMVVVDDDDQIWTTFYGPASEYSVILADYVDEIDPEELELPPLYVVDLSRDTTETVTLLPGLQLLLPGSSEP